ncbi:DNA transposase THAP9 isoform X1 [Mauremys reevesii]|uniref:DNA transposase THAP9 isoform X1 n=2 Tax=Mauremys reevesii TaxID=260615 RepID=UPI00193F1661|nr:DNA transposase THAP9 isoform X1 [Mauremys reevesii]
MTRSCSALGCTTRDTGLSRKRGISFHQFPIDDIQRTKWIHAVNRADPQSKKVWIPGPGAILCSRHFAEADFESYGMRRKLRKGAVPSVFLYKDPLSTYLKNRRSQKALKQPLLQNSPDEEVITADHNYSLKSPATAAEQQTEMKEIIQLPKKKLVTARRGLSYRERNVFSVINELAKKKLLSEEAKSLLQAQFSDLQWEPCSWRQMTEYSTEMRQFVCTLHLYSSKAYDYVRKNCPLPHPSSLTNWLSNDEGSPGFSNSIFFHLQQRVEQGEQAYQYCSLMIEGMALKKQLEWDPVTQRLVGFVDLGAGALDADEAPLASEAVVLMAVGVLGHWRAPLGYFFVNGTTGHLLAQLLYQTISKLTNVGIRVLSVTSAATAHGVELAKALGIRIDANNMQCTFQHPHSATHRITYFFDACHMLQLIRNVFQCSHRIQSIYETAHWQHIVDLVTLQETELLHISDRLSGRPGNSESCHLRVNYAAQLFSESVAGTLECLQLLGLPSFQNCGGTIKFVRLMSYLFDIFHGRSYYGTGLKGPVSSENYARIHRLLTEAKSVFVALTDTSGRHFLKGKHKLGFLGFLLNAESLKWLYTNYVFPKSMPFRHLLTYTFSLDHLELFLSTLRQACASCDNPTCMMFWTAYSKLLTKYNLTPGLHQNLIFGDMNTLDVSIVRRTDLALDTIHSQYNRGCVAIPSTDYIYCTGHISFNSTLSYALTDLSLYAESVTYTAGYVAEKLAAAIRCEACVTSLFLLDDKILKCGSLLCIKKIGSWSLPSKSVRQVVSISEQVLKTHARVKDYNLNLKQQDMYLEQKILYELSEQSHLFSELNNHLFDGELCVTNHYTMLLRNIVQCYLNVRAEHAKKWGLEYCSGSHGSKKLTRKHPFSSSLKTYKSIQILPVP